LEEEKVMLTPDVVTWMLLTPAFDQVWPSLVLAL
jgi:hypothetical protein